MALEFKAGHVYHITYFEEINPPKGKFALCICVGKRFFFMINTENRKMYDCIPISSKDHSQLGQDRYVSCKNILTLSDHFKAEEKYPVSKEFLSTLIFKITNSIFLNEKEKESILNDLTPLLKK